MFFIIIKTIHLMAAFVYGGFLISDNLFIVRIQKALGNEEYTRIRATFAPFVRKVVPTALVIIVVTGLIMLPQVFGEVSENGLNTFQKILILKVFLGLWLGLRGILQVYFGIQPLVFKGHRLPFFFVITIVLLSQLMFLPI